MTDTVDALALQDRLVEAMREAAEAERHAYLDRQPGERMAGSWGQRIHDAILAALAAEGLSIVNTAELERLQRHDCRDSWTTPAQFAEGVDES